MTDDSLVIRLHNIHRMYKIGSDKVHALRGINLEVRRNEYVAVMGHSGSGKSTLMNVIGCLDRADEGSYEIRGIRTTAPPARRGPAGRSLDGTRGHAGRHRDGRSRMSAHGNHTLSHGR